MNSEQVKVPVTQNIDRPLVRAGEAAILVIDRLLDHGQNEALPKGWSTVFANTPLADLYRQLFAEAGMGRKLAACHF